MEVTDLTDLLQQITVRAQELLAMCEQASPLLREGTSTIGFSTLLEANASIPSLTRACRETAMGLPKVTKRLNLATPVPV